MCHQQVYEQVMREEEWEEDCLPAHKRSGYAEKMYEQADMMRKQKREEELMKSTGDDNGTI